MTESEGGQPPFVVSSDPWAWLRPIYRQVSVATSFALLSTEHQFDLLIVEVLKTSEAKARQLRMFNASTKVAMLGHLRNAESLRPGPRSVTLWELRKDTRVLSRVALYMSHGIDVRMLIGSDVRRTQLVKDDPEAERLGEEWRTASIALGWKS